MEHKLLEKTEPWITPVTLEGADLGACARAGGGALAGAARRGLIHSGITRKHFASDFTVRPSIPRRDAATIRLIGSVIIICAKK